MSRGIALDGVGNMYLPSDDALASPPAILVFVAGALGKVAPLRTIAGGLTNALLRERYRSANHGRAAAAQRRTVRDGGVPMSARLCTGFSSDLARGCGVVALALASGCSLTPARPPGRTSRGRALLGIRG